MNKAEQQKLLPYIPKNRKIEYVSSSNKFMKEANRMLSNSGCAKQPTAAVIVKNGKIVGYGVNAGKKVDVCPREIQNYPTGIGYELCKAFCQQKGHCETVAIYDALKGGNDLRGAKLYLDGHWWICESCWEEIIRVGIGQVFLRRDALDLYKKNPQ